MTDAWVLSFASGGSSACGAQLAREVALALRGADELDACSPSPVPTGEFGNENLMMEVNGANRGACGRFCAGLAMSWRRGVRPRQDQQVSQAGGLEGACMDLAVRPPCVYRAPVAEPTTTRPRSSSAHLTHATVGPADIVRAE